MSKNVPKSVQTCFEHVWRGIFSKIFFLPSAPRRVETSKKIKNFSNFQKCPKTFSKVSKHVLNMFGGDFFEIFVVPSAPRRVETSKKIKKKQKIFKFSKMSKNVPKSVQTCFEHVWR